MEHNEALALDSYKLISHTCFFFLPGVPLFSVRLFTRMDGRMDEQRERKSDRQLKSKTVRMNSK